MIKVCKRFAEIRETSANPLVDLVRDPAFQIGELSNHRCVKVKRCIPIEKPKHGHKVDVTELDLAILEDKREMDRLMKMGEEELEKLIAQEKKKIEMNLEHK